MKSRELGEVLNYLNSSHIEVTKVGKHCLSSCFTKMQCTLHDFWL